MKVYTFHHKLIFPINIIGHPRIIHRDIKAANILLDHNYEAKVFGKIIGNLWGNLHYANCSFNFLTKLIITSFVSMIFSGS